MASKRHYVSHEEILAQRKILEDKVATGRTPAERKWIRTMLTQDEEKIHRKGRREDQKHLRRAKAEKRLKTDNQPRRDKPIQ